MSPKIPIKNLFYLLCYAWDVPELRTKIQVDGEECRSSCNFLAHVMAQVCEQIVKRGLQQEYRYQQVEVEGVRGKMNVAETLKSGRHRLGFTQCQVDEMSQDVLINQIIYTTLLHLTRISDIDKAIVDRIRRVLRGFPRLKQIRITYETFDRVHLGRNSFYYKMAIQISKLLFRFTLPYSYNDKHLMFFDFTENEFKMNELFEKFLMNFCKYHFTKEFSEIRRERIHFQLSPFGMMFKMAGDTLPVMETDISLSNPAKGTKQIIDAKYYSEALVSKYNAHEKIRRDHLSQIISYVMNQEDPKKSHTMNASGTLVYPTVSEDFDFSYRYKHTNHIIRVVTVNLNQDWQEIESRLKEIIL